MNYLLHILTMINIYVILVLSLNLLVGYVGLLSLSHAAFYGIGAYISTLLIMKLGLGFLPALLLAVVGTVLLSYTISLPSLRLRGDYFVLASLGFQIIVFTILYNWIDLTRGPYGIPGIPRPIFFGIEINSIGSYFLFSGVIAAICTGLLYLIGNSPFGRVLKAIREDEIAAAALGKNIVRLKINAFAIAAGFAAAPGALFAGYLRYIDPTSFTVMESVFILSIIIIGGAGNISGPIVGTVLMIFLPEVLRFIGLPDAVAANMRQIIYGLLIILIMRYRPQGLSGEYRFE
ncbi:branched-chain amino acid ABC transporter permease [candidate division KSB1 bacterium]|nr:branched-chain amino acid ABC transporter permease [candidate division KSB1 bacterium]